MSKTASPTKPPSSAPTTPTASVPKQPISWRPGVSARATAPASNPALLPAVVRRLDQAGLMAAELAFRLPSLDEVFLTLTGDPAEDTPGSTESLIDDDGRAA